LALCSKSQWERGGLNRARMGQGMGGGLRGFSRVEIRLASVLTKFEFSTSIVSRRLQTNRILSALP
jgi:hypothetical protein